MRTLARVWISCACAVAIAGCFSGVPCTTSADCRAGGGVCEPSLKICVIGAGASTGGGEHAGGGGGRGEGGGRDAGAGGGRGEGGGPDGGASPDGGLPCTPACAPSEACDVLPDGAGRCEKVALAFVSPIAGDELIVGGSMTVVVEARLADGGLSSGISIPFWSDFGTALEVQASVPSDVAIPKGAALVGIHALNAGWDGGSLIAQTVYLRSTHWTWASGSNLGNLMGVYGVKGAAAAENMPGGRDGAASWADRSGNLWLFGGRGYGSTWGLGRHNDLWRFDGANWAWVSGSDIGGSKGVYGVKGVAAPENVPGARERAVAWTGSSGDLWIFGGSGYDGAGAMGDLNDLWRFDGVNWAWVSGGNVVGQPGVYGTKGSAEVGNGPGARSGATGWTDGTGNLWLFGGVVRDTNGFGGGFNDLWRFDGTSWVWMSGFNGTGGRPVYGTKGTASAGNVPSDREGAAGWLDNSGNLWLFGGKGTDSTGLVVGLLDDLWRYDGANWGWMGGSDIVYQKGDYGTMGVPADSNAPGARAWAASCMDGTGNRWLWGGSGVDSAGRRGTLNDLWRFDGGRWVWVRGSNMMEQKGVFGTRGASAAANVPGARSVAACWAGGGGSLWLFGGEGYDLTTGSQLLNDLWRFTP